jgi:hypothetical protein
MTQFTEWLAQAFPGHLLVVLLPYGKGSDHGYAIIFMSN